ncbi:MAG TPA: hypothetical protein VK302_10575 [Terriglobales bacterium]|nr:hypothetical protein [Terriglobales bacterium]
MSLLPDLQFIRETIRVIDVARKLNLDVISRSSARCWRGQNHKNGDRTPSLSFDARKNRVRCFVCDNHSLSNLDLVMSVRGCNVREAAEWIARNFPGVPSLPKGRHIAHRDRSNLVLRAGIESVRSAIVRYGVFATLTPAEQSILHVLEEFATTPVELSYLALARFSGIGSSATIAKALKHFQKIGLLSVQRESSEGLRAINRYVLTPESEQFQRLLLETHARQRQEVEAEREIRKELRAARRPYKSNTFLQSVKRGEISRFTQESVNFDTLSPATSRIPVKPSHDNALPRTFLVKGGHA